MSTPATGGSPAAPRVGPAQGSPLNRASPPTARPAVAPGAAAPAAAPRATSSPGGSNGSAKQSGRKSRANRRPPRLASLQLKRVDPWTVLKISLIVAIVMFFVWMIAVGILYLSLGSMNVWSKINETFNTLTNTGDTTAPSDLITPARVFSVTAVIGAINIVLFTALATVAAFVYNAAAGMAGGVELTLGERD